MRGKLKVLPEMSKFVSENIYMSRFFSLVDLLQMEHEELGCVASCVIFVRNHLIKCSCELHVLCKPILFLIYS